MHRTLIWRGGSASASTSDKEISPALGEQNSVVWLDISGEIDEEQQLLTHVCGISRLSIESIKDRTERARLIHGPHYYHLILYALIFKKESEDAITPKLDILFGKNIIITVRQESLDWLDRAWDSMYTGSHEDTRPFEHGTMGLLHFILDSLVDSYFPVLDTLDDVIDELEDVTISSTSDQVQVRIFRMKRSVATMRRVISPQIEVLNSLSTRASNIILPEMQPNLDEVHDHMIRAFEVLDSYRDLMSGLLDVYLSTISNRLNVVMKQLTIIATIFMPITFITGVFGQNFRYMPQVRYDPGYAFFLVLALMALITALQLWYFKRRGIM